MKPFTITITGECADEIPDEWLDQVSAAAEVQVLEPQVDNPGDSYNPLEFKTTNVNTVVSVGVERRIAIRDVLAAELLSAFGISVQDDQEYIADRMMETLWPLIAGVPQ